MLKLIATVAVVVQAIGFIVWLMRKPKHPFEGAPQVWARETVKVSALGLLCLIICAMPIAVILFLLVNVR